MTARSELSHRLRELKARVQTALAGQLFSLRGGVASRLVKRLMKADRPAAYHDPELEHPAPAADRAPSRPLRR